MLTEIDNVELLEEIYHFVKRIFEIAQEEKQRKGGRCLYEL